MEQEKKCEFENIPLEIRRYILSLLKADDLWTCLSVSKIFRKAANDELLWKRHCLKEEILGGSVRPGSESHGDLCTSAIVWGIWRWEGGHSWKYNKFEEVSLNGMLNFGQETFTSYKTRLAFYSKTEHEVIVLSKNRKISFDVPYGLTVTELHMNSRYIFVTTRDGLLTYKDDRGYFSFYRAIFFCHGVIKIFKDSIPPTSNQDYCLACIGLVNDQVWTMMKDCKHILGIEKVFFIDLLSCDFRKMTFPRDTVYSLTERHFIAYLQYQWVNVYNLCGEKIFSLRHTDSCFVLASRNVIVIFGDPWQNQMETYDITNGKKISKLEKYLRAWTCDIRYDYDILFGIHVIVHKNALPFKHEAVVEALCLKTANTLWRRSLLFTECSTRFILDRYLIVYSNCPKHYLLLDINNGKILNENQSSSQSGIVLYVSDNVWVSKLLENNYIAKFY